MRQHRELGQCELTPTASVIVRSITDRSSCSCVVQITIIYPDLSKYKYMIVINNVNLMVLSRMRDDRYCIFNIITILYLLILQTWSNFYVKSLQIR